MELLIELRLSSLESEPAIREIIETLNMRQLDRLKLMFSREYATKPVFSEEIMVGIRGNDFASFSRAVQILNSLMKKHN